MEKTVSKKMKAKLEEEQFNKEYLKMGGI